MTASIAVVGMACRYPGAATPDELWENVLAQRRAFRRIPSQRLRLADYQSADRTDIDRTYLQNAAVLEGWDFERVRFRVAGSTFRSTDLTHWLALEVAADALRDAGFEDGKGLPRERTGALIGNTLTGEFSRASNLRLRWPYVRRVVANALLGAGWAPDDLAIFLDALEEKYKAPFAPPGEETLAGGLSNTIAGRICNYFDLNGGGFVVDGACASSLLAMSNACAALSNGDLDVAIVGGVDLSLDPFELVGFARNGAFANGEMRVFDARSAGFWPGEGCGMAVLMRADDALATGRRVRARVSGWGISSDGSGGMTRPEVKGQQMALLRAWERAGGSPASVAYFEGHGTGTAVGDATELKAIATTLRECGGPARPLPAIGSIKANIGHTKAAAGIAGFIKVVKALESHTLPPHTNAQRPHPEMEGALRMLREAENWPSSFPLRAGVSSFGFGGINCHVAVEASDASAPRARSLGARERRLAASVQDVELFAWSAPDVAALLELLRPVLERAPGMSWAELVDLSCVTLRGVRPGAVRLAIVAQSPVELAERLAAAAQDLSHDVRERLDAKAGIFFSCNPASRRVGLLFSGQGAPSCRDGGLWVRRFPAVRALYEQAQLPTGGDDVATEVAQPSIVTASLAALKVLESAGVRASVAVGHSLGELTALHWAGAYDEPSLLDLARVRGRAMANLGASSGAMASIAAPLETAAQLVDGLGLSVAGHNGPGQTVVSGPGAQVDAAIERAKARGLDAVRLRVSHAFHSPLVAAAARPVAEKLASIEVSPPSAKVISTVLGRPVARQDDVRALLETQIVAPVLFQEAVAAAGPVDLWIEAGPGKILADMAAHCGAPFCLAIESGAESLAGLCRVLAACHALGNADDLGGLAGSRFCRPFDPLLAPSFLQNPCEQVPADPAATAVKCEPSRIRQAPAQVEQPSEAADAGLSTVEVVRRLVAARAELPPEAVGDEDRLLADLHLNSIAVTQIATEAARKLGIGPLSDPLDFARAAVRPLAAVLDELRRGGKKAERRVPAGVDAWVRAFEMHWTAAERGPVRNQDAGDWKVLSLDAQPFAAELAARLSSGAHGRGVAVCLSGGGSPEELDLLLRAARSAAEMAQPAAFVVVQPDQGATGFASTVHIENPSLRVCAIEAPSGAGADAAGWIAAEIAASEGFTVCRYDAGGRRYAPELRLVPPPRRSSPDLSGSDVILVTGGGKGIGAECALALAGETRAKVGIVGRSAPGSSEELAANLSRFAAAGVAVHYAAADVRDAAAMKRAAAEIEARLGKITVVLHAAGVNTPRSLAELTSAQLQETVEIKLGGMRNTLAVVGAEGLRAVLGFGSVIGRMGMMGEADYALANGLLTAEMERLAAKHPRCRWLTLEWSAWSGAGMAERLGRVEALTRQGIEPISVRHGLDAFLELMRTEGLSSSVLVAGRLGAKPAIPIAGESVPFLRFLERTPVKYPRIEVVAESDLSARSDPGVDDHRLHGDRIVPAVLLLESLAQTSSALVALPETPCFSDVKIGRAVVVPEGSASRLRVAALASPQGDAVKLAVRYQDTAFQVDHLRASCAGASGLPQPLPVDAGGLRSHREVDPAKHLYGPLLFHTGRFQRVTGYRNLGATECVADLRSEPSEWFARALPQRLLLGDPAARDAGLQAIQACLPHRRVLPTAVEEIRLRSPDAARRVVRARERSRGDLELVWDLDYFAADGAHLESWRGLVLRVVQELALPSRWSAALLAAWVERRIPELCPGAKVSVALEIGDDRRARSDAALSWLCKEPVHRAPDGRPTAPGRALSAAHHGALTLAVAGEGQVACDLEGIEPRPPSAWREMLGAERFELARLIEREGSQPFEVAATRVWTAVECARKAGLPPSAPLVLSEARSDGWTLLAAGPHPIATVPAQVEGTERPLIVAVLAGSHARV
ncbi:MAG TPA: SDR family NAD(P)-dependent oxidoreductase [Myxococcales bacterium]